MPIQSAIAESPPLRVVNAEAVESYPLDPPADHTRSVLRPLHIPWWLWPHLLSLDAPLVAILWQRWWARSTRLPLVWSDELILGLGVWLIYLADRLADTTSSISGGHQTTRHTFYRQRHRTMQPVAVAVFLALVWLAPGALSRHQFFAGLGLLSLTGGYFWLIHCRSRRDWPGFVPKEAAVGIIFALGTGFFVLVRSQRLPLELFIALPFFGTLCFFNCALITKWECDLQDLSEPSSLLNAFPTMTARLDSACMIFSMAALVAAAVLPRGSIVAPVAIGAMLLVGLDRCRPFLSANALRVLADAALLSPWLCLAVPFHVP